MLVVRLDGVADRDGRQRLRTSPRFSCRATGCRAGGRDEFYSPT